MRELKNIVGLLLAAVWLVGCQPTEAKTEEDGDGSQFLASFADAFRPRSEERASPEYLEWESLRINSRLQLSTNAQQAALLLGQPDSVVTPDYENVCSNCHFCGLDALPYKKVYYKGLEFERFNDSLVFWSADFTKDPGLSLKAEDFQLNHTTTLREIREKFPKAAGEMGKDGGGAWIKLSPSKEPSDGSFILEFNKQGTLTKLHYWLPC